MTGNSTSDLRVDRENLLVANEIILKLFGKFREILLNYGLINLNFVLSSHELLTRH